MPGAFTGYYLDGRSAARRPASIRLAASGLEIALEDGARLWWPFREVRQTQGFYRGEQIRLERGTPFPEILLVDDNAFLASLHATAPRFGRRFHDPRRRRTRLLLTIGAAATAVAIGAVLYVWGIPAAAGMLAARVPVSWEERGGGGRASEAAGCGCRSAGDGRVLRDHARRGARRVRHVPLSGLASARRGARRGLEAAGRVPHEGVPAAAARAGLG